MPPPLKCLEILDNLPIYNIFFWACKGITASKSIRYYWYVIRNFGIPLRKVSDDQVAYKIVRLKIWNCWSIFNLSWPSCLKVCFKTYLYIYICLTSEVKVVKRDYFDFNFVYCILYFYTDNFSRYLIVGLDIICRNEYLKRMIIGEGGVLPYPLKTRSFPSPGNFICSPSLKLESPPSPWNWGRSSLPEIGGATISLKLGALPYPWNRGRGRSPLSEIGGGGLHFPWNLGRSASLKLQPYAPGKVAADAMQRKDFGGD